MKQKSISVQINGITHKLVEGYIGTIRIRIMLNKYKITYHNHGC